MREERRFKVTRCAARCELKRGGDVVSGSLENISLNGAMITLQESETTLLNAGERCFLKVFPGDNEPTLEFLVEVVHHVFSIVGIHFPIKDEPMLVRLCLLIGIVTNELECTTGYYPEQPRYADTGSCRLRLANSGP